MRCLYDFFSKHRIAGVKYLSILCACMACWVFKGCVPENMVWPEQFPNDTPSDTVVASSVTVPEAFTNYFETGISLSYTAAEVKVVFKVDIDWMMQVVDDAGNPVTWCSLSTDLGNAGLYKVKVGVNENLARASRSARIVLRSLDAASKMAEIAVEQEGVALFLERTDYEVAPHDTMIAVELKANVDFEYKIVDADWVHEQPAASRALTTHSVAFAIDANPSYESREAHILFCNSQYPVAADTLTIVQEGLTPTVTVPDGYTDYFAEDLTFNFVKGDAEVVFHSNVDWTLQLVAAGGDSASWCSVDQSSGKAGLQKMKVSVTDNDTYAHRSLTLCLMCDTIMMGEILVLQERENAILLGRKAYTVSCEATAIDVSLSTNVDFEYKLLDADWVREQQSATRGLTTHNLTFEVDANPSLKSREAKIIFYSSEFTVADTLTLIQEGIVPAVFIPEGYTDYFTDGLSFGPMADEAEVTFQVNVDWQLSVDSSESWLSIESSSGTAGKQTVTVRITDNNTKADRAATISLMCGDIKLDEIAVTQKRVIFPEGMESEIFPSRAFSLYGDFETNINVEYKIVDADWVHEQSSPTHSMNRYHIIFDVDANPSYESRSAELVFYNSRFNVSCSVTLIQAGMVTVVTGAVTNVTADGATINGIVNGSGESFKCGVIYDTTPALSYDPFLFERNPSVEWITTPPGEFSVNLTGLKANTVYYYRVLVPPAGVSAADYGFEYGEVLSFTTESKSD